MKLTSVRKLVVWGVCEFDTAAQLSALQPAWLGGQSTTVNRLELLTAASATSLELTAWFVHVGLLDDAAQSRAQRKEQVCIYV